MFRKIKEITFKISPYCNLDCEYCFQKYNVKEDKDMFKLTDSLFDFILKLPLDDTLEFKITGGESSLFCNEVKEVAKKLKKIERYKNTKVIFTTITNGTNLEGILDLMDQGIYYPYGCKYSWDGIHSASKSRKPKNTYYNDSFFNNKIKLLGKSKYKDDMLVRTALTSNTVDNLAESLQFVLDSGCTKWEYYYITDYEDYLTDEFQNKFKKQLKLICDIYNKTPFDFYNLITYISTSEYTELKDLYRSISCRHLGRSLYVNMDGSLSPCGFFSNDSVFDGCTMYIGDIFEGFYRKEMQDFIDEYTQIPMCNISTCKNAHCFECPATTKHREGHMQNKLLQACNLRSIESEEYRKLLTNMTIANATYIPNNLLVEESNIKSSEKSLQDLIKRCNKVYSYVTKNWDFEKNLNEDLFYKK